nr:MAG TPA: hypothetical protein [Caudoviricetes sp.]
MVGGIKISASRKNGDRSPLTRTKSKVQTGY